MTNSLKKRIQSSFSIFNIFALTLQSFMPGFFMLFPAKTFAVEKQEVGKVDLEFLQEESIFDLAVVSDSDVEYTLEYVSQESDTKNGVKGVAVHSDSGVALATEYAGTCSVDDCVPNKVDSGRLELPNASFATDFVVLGENLWLVSDKKAEVPTVELNTIYSAPQNSEVQVVFTKLPENPGSLVVEEITLTEEQAQQLDAYSTTAYDISSDMADGTFEYELTLPLPEGADEKAGLVYAESVSELDAAVAVEGEEISEGVVSAKGLDHFTVFVVTKDPVVGCPGGAYSSGVCYATIQAAINAADPTDGIDTISVDSGTYLEDLSITKSVVLEGANVNLNPNTDSRGVESTIVGQIFIAASNVTVNGFKISNPTYNGPTIKGIHLYKNGSYISNIEIKSNLLEDINNANTKGSYGIMVQAAIDSVSIINNKINNLNSAGWTHAIEVTPSGGGTEVPTNVTITGNVISNISNNAHTDEYAFSVDWSSSNTLFANASEIVFSNNTILGGSVRNLDSAHVLDARNNNWGVATFQEIEDKVNHNCSQWKLNSGLSGLVCDGSYDSSLIGIVDYLNPIGAQKSITFTNTGTPTLGGTNSVIALEVEATYLPYGVERVRFRYAPQGQTCQQQYTSPYFNDLGDGVKNGDLYSVNWDTTGLPSGIYTACALMHRNTGAASEGYKNDNHAEFQVVIDNSGPAAPTIVFPNAEQYFSTTPILNDWSNVTDDSGIDHYRIQYEYDDHHTFSGYPYRETTASQRNHTPGVSEQGGVSFRVQAFDSLGNEGTWSEWRHYYYDSIAPEVPTLIKPTNNAVVNGATLLSDWSDVTGAVKYIYESYHDAGATNLRWHDEYTQSQKTATNVANATFWWRVKAVDAAGNQSAWSDLWKVTVDNDAPDVEVTTPAAGLVNGIVEVRGTVTDANPHHYWFVIQNSSGTTVAGPGTVNDTTSFTNKLLLNWDTTSLPSGEYTIKLEARDSANNKDGGSVDWVKVQVDNTRPTVTITSPANDSAFNGPFSVLGTADDTDSGVKDIRVRFRNESDNALVATFWATYDSGSKTWSLDINDGTNIVPEGNYRIVVHVRDNNGNSRNATRRRVHVDTTNPSSIITTFDLEDGGEVETAVFDGLIQGTATDEPTEIASGVTEVLLEIMHTPFGESEGSFWNGSDWQSTTATVSATGTTNWSYHIPEESVLEGTYTIESHAVDAAGNVESTYTITIVYDRTIPEVTLTIDPTSPDAANGWYKTNPTVTLTANDNYSVDYIEYQWNSTAGAWTTYSSPINPPGEGQNVLYYRSVDTVGNVSDIGVKEVKYDATAPTEGPLNVRVENVGSTTADGKWQKPNGADYVHEYRLSWKHENGTEHSATVSSETYEHKLDNLFDGLWEFRVTAADAAGHTISATTKFRVGPEPSPDSGSVLGVTTGGGTGTGGSFVGSQNSSNTENSQDSQQSEANEEKDGSSQTDESGSVLGDTDNSCATWKFYLPLFLLLIQVLFAVSLEIANREPNAKKLLFALAISGLLMGAFYILRDASCFEGTGIMQSLAKWFVPVSVGLAFLLRGIGSMTVEEK